MLREAHQNPPTNQPTKEAKEQKRRFQIVKLEERIAPAGHGKTGAKDQCNAGYKK